MSKKSKLSPQFIINTIEEEKTTDIVDIRSKKAYLYKVDGFWRPTHIEEYE